MPATARVKRSARHFGTKSGLPLTDREVYFLRFVAKAIDRTGCQPSYREVMQEFGWQSLNAVRSLIENLEMKGVAYGEGCARSLRFKWKDYL
jgi:SOS-response transcriptional repressor LexA